jgi:hypothetical protein
LNKKKNFLNLDFEQVGEKDYGRDCINNVMVYSV